MKRKMKGKLLLSIATLSLALVSSVGSTFAWFYMNSEASTTGLDIEVTTGSAVKILDTDENIKDHISYYTDAISIQSRSDAKWTAIKPKTVTPAKAATTGDTPTPASEATMTVDNGFQTLDAGKVLTQRDNWYYSDLTGTTAPTQQAASITEGETKKSHVWGTSAGAAEGTSTSAPTAYYYKLDLKYMITTGYDLSISVDNIKVTNKAGNVLVGTTSGEETTGTATKDITADKVIRVAFQENNATSASVYRITDTTSTDYSTEGMNALIGKKSDDSDALKSDMYAVNKLGKHLVKESTITKTTDNQSSDKAFYYGNVSIYIWYDGTDYACSNEIFDQTCSFGLKFEASKATTSTGE